MPRSSLFRLGLVAIAAMLAALPFVMWGAERSLREMFNSPLNWIPAGNQQRREFFDFVRDFDTPDVIIVSWDGCTLDDERLDAFTPALAAADRGASPPNNPLFQRIVTGRDLVRILQAPPLSLSQRGAVRRLRGSLVGPDGVSCALVVLTRRGALERDAAIRIIGDVLRRELALQRDQFYLAGTPVIGWAIDRESVRALSVLFIPSGAIIVTLCCLFLKSWRLILLVLGTAFFGERLAVALVYYSGSNMNAVLIVLSPLVFVLAVSTGVHLANYLRTEVTARGAQGAALRTLRIAWPPCLLSTGTTAIGLLSLLVSEIDPVRRFAVFSVIALLLTTLLMLVGFGGIADRWPPRARPAGSSRSLVDGCLAGLSAFVARWNVWIVVAALSLAAVCGLGLLRARTTVEVSKLLDPSSRTIQDLHWLERHVLPSVPVEIVVRFDAANQMPLIERLLVVRDIHAAITRTPPVGGTLSALTFLPPVSDASGLSAAVQRGVFRARFQSAQSQLAELGYLAVSPDAQAWRVTARIPSQSDIDYRSFLDKLQTRAKAVARARAPSLAGIDLSLTGVLPLVESAQQTLVRDLVSSFVVALAVITVVTICGLRSLGLGMVAMIPNLFPLVVLFGAMGWLDQPLDIGAIMTASVALGIAVDDTLHFMFHWRREVRTGESNRSAVAGAIRDCGRAMTHTTLICGLGLLVFSLSQFEPTRRFAWMMFVLLSSALVGDLLLLPALLVGPLQAAARLARPRSD